MAEQFSAPTDRATWFFLRAIPTWMLVGIVTIVTEWGDDELLPAILAFLG